MSMHSILAAALELPESTTATELAETLAAKMTPQESANTAHARHLSDDPQAMFEVLARKASATLNISLSDAYSYVSKEAPTLWERSTKAAML